jgi:hypothetical protein
MHIQSIINDVFIMSKRPDPKTVERACYEALSVLGIRLKYGVGSLPIEEGFLGWIGLNQGTHSTFVRVNPNIGIHCVPLMKLIDDAAGEKYQSGRWATLSYPLGEACPDVKQFIFESEADVLSEAARLTETIKQYGIPYIRSLASYSAMLPRLRKQVDSLGGAPERYAAALYLSGDIRGAFNFLTEQIATFAARSLVDQAEKLNKLKLHLEASLS